MICSWLNPKTGVGSFFWEQAGFMTDDFNMILCVFKSTPYGSRSFNKFFIHETVTIEKAPNGLKILQINYPQFTHFSNKFNFYLFKQYLQKFKKYLVDNEINIDLVHAQSLVRAGIIAQYLYEETGIPYVFTEHRQFNYRYINNKDKNVISRIFSNQFEKMVVSHDKIRQLSSNGLFADYTVVGNAVDDEFFNYAGIKDETKILNIVTIGAFAEIKDQETMLKALQIVDRKLAEFSYKQVEFTWLGCNGWGKDNSLEVKKLVDSFNFDNIKVNIIPQVTRLEIKIFLQNSHLFLLSSISEGMTVSVMEALACGVPVFTTRCGGVDELIDDNNGKIVQIKDSKGMAAYILDFYGGKYSYDNKEISEEFIKQWGKDPFRSKMSVIYNRMINKYGILKEEENLI